MRRAIGVAAGVGAASVGAVTLITLAGRRSRAAVARAIGEPVAEQHMWAVLAGEAPT